MKTALAINLKCLQLGRLANVLIKRSEDLDLLQLDDFLKVTSEALSWTSDGKQKNATCTFFEMLFNERKRIMTGSRPFVFCMFVFCCWTELNQNWKVGTELPRRICSVHNKMFYLVHLTPLPPSYEVPHTAHWLDFCLPFFIFCLPVACYQSSG